MISATSALQLLQLPKYPFRLLVPDIPSISTLSANLRWANIQASVCVVRLQIASWPAPVGRLIISYTVLRSPENPIGAALVLLLVLANRIAEIAPDGAVKSGEGISAYHSKELQPFYNFQVAWKRLCNSGISTWCQ